MKTFAVAFSSESGDYYYDTFLATGEPSSEQVIKAFTEKFGDEIDYIYVDHVWEVKPKIKVNNKKGLVEKPKRGKK